MFNFIKNIFTKRNRARKIISKKEVKEMFKGFTKNQLIQVILKLTIENSNLKTGIKK